MKWMTRLVIKSNYFVFPKYCKMNKRLLKNVFVCIVGVSFVFTITVVMTDRYSNEIKMESNSKILYRYDLPKVGEVRNDTIVSNGLMYPNENKRCENNHTRLFENTIIIVPYRSRSRNLKLFLPYLHQHLINQVWI